MNLVGDIQGNYRTLLALLKQMPDDDPVSVGDMIDRGPRSMEVLEFFRNHGKALLGNHEHMMLDYFCDSGNYMPDLWLMNSGDATLNSLGLKRSGSLPEILQDFLESLPLLLIRDGLLVTHAPHTARNLEPCRAQGDETGAAPRIRTAAHSQTGLCRPSPADRRGTNHQPALRGGLDVSTSEFIQDPCFHFFPGYAERSA